MTETKTQVTMSCETDNVVLPPESGGGEKFGGCLLDDPVNHRRVVLMHDRVRLWEHINESPANKSAKYTDYFRGSSLTIDYLGENGEKEKVTIKVDL